MAGRTRESRNKIKTGRHRGRKGRISAKWLVSLPATRETPHPQRLLNSVPQLPSLQVARTLLHAPQLSDNLNHFSAPLTAIPVARGAAGIRAALTHPVAARLSRIRSGSGI
eukprot:3608260-Alexandrium_andersonii.AAC.1